MDKRLETIIDMLNHRSNLCFNWIDQTATTSRYQEWLRTSKVSYLWSGEITIKYFLQYIEHL